MPNNRLAPPSQGCVPIWKMLHPPLHLTRITRMHSSRMCTTRSLTVSYSIWCWGGLPNTPPVADPPTVNRMTHRCRNITLPQTSFAVGNYSNAQDAGRLWQVLRHVPLVGSTWDLTHVRSIVRTPPRWYSPWTARHRSRTRVWLRLTASVQSTPSSRAAGTRSHRHTCLN